MNKEYGTWCLADIKAELRKRNAKVSGKKAVLIQRLHDYDTIFGPVINEPDSAYILKIPEPEFFRDITSDTNIPPFIKEDLDVFCTLAEREDLSTGQKMYSEGFLLSIRSATQANNSFIVATCASEMRKQVTYKVCLKYEEHAMKEAQCECAAGMGPHAQCKHVIMVQYALIDFTRTKKIKTRPSCTSNLQNFHHPTKFYTGNPVEAEKLQMKLNNKSLQDITNFDPRPLCSQETKEKYTESFTNLITNFCALKQVSMPLAQLRKPANKKAIYHDHDYLQKTFEEQYIESLNMNTEELNNFQETTKSDNVFWKEQRLYRLHSTNFYKICKCKNENKKKLAKLLLKNSDVMTQAMKHGILYEKKAVNEFSQRTGLDTKKCGIIVYPDCQYIASTPDRLIGDDAVLEVKCPFSAFKKQISTESVPYLYLCEKTGNFKLKKAHEYFYQVQGQLLCTGRQIAYFCVYTITDMTIEVIQRDEDFILSMIEKLSDFYNGYYKEQFLNRHLYNIKI